MAHLQFCSPLFNPVSLAGVESECNGHFKLLFSLLKQTMGDGKMQLLGLQVINAVTANVDCVKDIAAAKVLVYLLFTLQTVPEGELRAEVCGA